MPDELPPNKVCPKCGVENLATASHCLECHAPLRAGLGHREEVLWIDGKSGGVLPRRWSAWKGFFRVMSVPGCTALAFAVYPDPDGKGAAAMLAFLASAMLAVAATIGSETPGRAGRGPHDGWVIVDGLLRGIGCLVSALAALGVSLFACFLAVCYCGSRR